MINMELTQELYEALMPYEVHLRRGYKGRYTFGLTKPIFENLYKIYKELGFERQQTYSCSGCLLDLTTTLGRLYFDYQEERQKQAELVEQQTEDSQTDEQQIEDNKTDEQTEIESEEEEKLTEIPLESSQTESVEQLQADGNKVAKKGGKVVRKANKTTSKRKAVK